jgi:hypothetical protein
MDDVTIKRRNVEFWEFDSRADERDSSVAIESDFFVLWDSSFSNLECKVQDEQFVVISYIHG